MQRGMMMQFDKLPLPVYVLRVEADASGLPQDFIFVYANSACASFLGIDGKNYLLGMSFSDIWGDNGAKWLNIYTKTALEGLTQNIEDYNENLKKYLSVDCYQPMYGYCGCFYARRYPAPGYGTAAVRGKRTLPGRDGIQYRSAV